MTKYFPISSTLINIEVYCLTLALLVYYLLELQKVILSGLCKQINHLVSFEMHFVQFFHKRQIQLNVTIAFSLGLLIITRKRSILIPVKAAIFFHKIITFNLPEDIQTQIANALDLIGSKISLEIPNPKIINNYYIDWKKMWRIFCKV